jgi:hypothetical protein
MANYAVIDENLVVNMIVAESKEDAEQLTQKTCVEVDIYAQTIISDITTWDGTNFTTEL